MAQQTTIKKYGKKSLCLKIHRWLKTKKLKYLVSEWFNQTAQKQIKTLLRN